MILMAVEKDYSDPTAFGELWMTAFGELWMKVSRRHLKRSDNAGLKVQQ